MAEHTPTPWFERACHVYARGPNGANICTMSEPRASTTVGYTEVEIGSRDLEEAHENAAFIVRAVNSHAELIAALNAMTERYVTLAGSGDCGFWDPETEQEVIDARAALAHAEASQ